MTPEQYERIKPLKGAIQDRSASGATAQEMAAIFSELTGRPVNMGCKSCIEEMLNYLTGQMMEYEKKMQANT